MNMNINYIDSSNKYTNIIIYSKSLIITWYDIQKCDYNIHPYL